MYCIAFGQQNGSLPVIRCLLAWTDAFVLCFTSWTQGHGPPSAVTWCHVSSAAKNAPGFAFHAIKGLHFGTDALMAVASKALFAMRRRCALLDIWDPALQMQAV